MTALLGNIYLAAPKRAVAGLTVDVADARIEDLGAMREAPALARDAAALTSELR